MPSKGRIRKNISGRFGATPWCITLFTWLAAFSLLFDSAFGASNCGTPPAIDKAYIDSQTDVEVRYKCKSGYEPGATKTKATCGGSNWVFDDNRPLVCRPVSCGTPPEKEHASYTEKSFFFGDDVNYICDTGYKQDQGVKDNNNIQCQPNGRWTVVDYTCGPVTCSALSDPANGNVRIISGSTGKYDYKHKYKFECNKGFMSKGRDIVEVTCTASGKWSEENVKCEEGICPEPPTPENAIKLHEGNVYGDLREYRCKVGYEMVGDSDNSIASYCQKDGKWSLDPLPTCRHLPVPCTNPSKPYSPANGYAEKVSDNEYRIKCNPRYKLESGDSHITVKCRTTDGTWSIYQAKCIEVDCGKPTIPHNGELVHEDGTTYTIRCQDGFKLVGRQVGDTVLETCQSNGKWTQNNNPVCKEVTCGSPNIPTNWELVANGPKTYTIRCKDGFKPEKGADMITVTCQNNAQWTPINAVCTEVTCGPPNIPTNWELVANGPKTYTIRCKDGFKPEEGADMITVTCQNNAQWTPINAVCTEETCDKSPTAPNNGKIEVVKDKDKTYTITCKKGYVISGGDTVTCSINRRWSPTTTTCKKEADSGASGLIPTIAIIVFSIIGGAVVIGIITFFIYRRHKKKEGSNRRPAAIAINPKESKPLDINSKPVETPC